MNSCELITFVTAIACQIAQDNTTDEVEVLGAIFTQLGDTLTTIAINNNNKSKEDEVTEC